MSDNKNGYLELENLLNIKRELNRINFGKDGIIQVNNYYSEYKFKDLKENEGSWPIHEIRGYCDECQGKLSKPKNGSYSKYELKTMMHGAHTLDFLYSQGLTDNELVEILKKWNGIPVLFLLENTGKVHDFYDQTLVKWPTKQWYWVHGPAYTGSNAEYPCEIRKNRYSSQFFTLINSFKLSNVYVTDLVKCGMNSIDKKYLTVDKYNYECITKCANKYLKEEIRAITKYSKDLIVMAFGNNSFYYGKDLINSISRELGLNVDYYHLPHPQARKGNAYRKRFEFLCFYVALKRKGISSDFARTLFEKDEGICDDVFYSFIEKCEDKLNVSCDIDKTTLESLYSESLNIK